MNKTKTEIPGFEVHEGDINVIFEFNIDGKKYQEHHIISDKNARTAYHELWTLSGADPQSRDNKIFLPTAPEHHPTRSIHSGRHWESVSRELQDEMDKAINLGKLEKWLQAEYKEALSKILEEERSRLRSGDRSLNSKMREWSDDKGNKRK